MGWDGWMGWDGMGWDGGDGGEQDRRRTYLECYGFINFFSASPFICHTVYVQCMYPIVLVNPF